MDFDVIIAGGGFARLAAAVQLRGKRVLLFEPHPVGAVQVHKQIYLHLVERVVELALEYPFYTSDYSTFCDRLLEKCGADMLQASVLGHRG